MRGALSRGDCARRTRRGRSHNSTRLEVEPLEQRLLMSWGDIPSAAVRIPSNAVAVTLDDRSDAQGTALISRREVDLYTFVAPNTGTYRFSASTPHSSLDTVLAVFEVNRRRGSRVAFNDDTAPGFDTDSQLVVDLQAGHAYAFGITNYTRTPGGAYEWSVDGPSRDASGDDEYEDNDSLAQAYNLGTLTAFETITGLAMADSQDWYHFQMGSTGTTADYVAARFLHAAGDLDVRLYDSSGTLVRLSDSVTNAEQISLNELAAGDYYLEVYGYQEAQNPNYTLEIRPGSGSTPTASDRTLYLNFDGSNISRADLVEWAETDWADMIGELDRDRNGIVVRPFLETRSDREQIIDRMMSMLQQDLAPFGISVQRHTGSAVEKVGATTVFLGPSTLSNDYYHVACDVDYGNNNHTDIAFVGDEDWGSATVTATALADVVLHEAGHTWGLYHVNSGTSAETMGLRYSIDDQSRWATDTSYMDRTFVQFVDASGFAHGPGPQNSYRTMLRNFGSASATPSADMAVPLTMVDTSRAGVFALTTGAAAGHVVVRPLDDGTVELTVNGQAYVLGTGLREIEIHTQGDSRDQIDVLGGPLAAGVSIDADSAVAGAPRDKTPLSLAAHWNGNPTADSPRESEHHVRKASNPEITLPQDVRGTRGASVQRTDALSWLVESLHHSRNARPSRRPIETA